VQVTIKQLFSPKSFITTSCFAISLVFLIVFHSSIDFNFQSSPITNCLPVYDESEIFNRYSLKESSRNKTIFSYLQHCQSNYCKKVVRVCSDGEIPMFGLFELLGELFIFFVFSFVIAPMMLNYLGDYENVYKTTKKLKFCKPVIHFTLLQDSLKDNRPGCWKIKRLKLIKEAYKVDEEILNKKGKKDKKVPNFSGNYVKDAKG